MLMGVLLPLAEAIVQSKTMTTLDVRENKIGDEGAKALAEAIVQSKTMTTLDVGFNSIGDEGANNSTTRVPN